MPATVVRAVLAAEDARFFEHGALDWPAIGRAMVHNAMPGERLMGGSTITQQLAKGQLLATEPQMSPMERKIRESLLAWKLERELTKSEILQRYLSNLYFSPEANGIEDAALVFFGKSARDLELAEAAMLAGMIAAPTHYNPVRHPDRAKQRRAYVLERLRQLGWATPQEIEAAHASDLPR